MDRDGTINKEVNYLYKPDDFVFVPGTVEAIKILHKLGYKVIVITNQAGVARGYYDEKDIKMLHKYIDALLEKEGTYINAYYYCPHHPEGLVENYSMECKCRKPQIGLIKKAVEEFKIDLSKSIIIGDKEIDILTGKNAGIGKSVLVKSGHPADEKDTLADLVYDDLYDFAIELASKS